MPVRHDGHVTLPVLTADCSQCVALCCVLPAFGRSDDFAIDKPAGTPCPHLRGDDRCTIHDRLRERGFRGCVVFDCFGAGQRLTAAVDGAERWRTSTAVRSRLDSAFAPLVAVHELLWYVEQVAALGVFRDLLTLLRDKALAVGTAPSTEQVRTLRQQAAALFSGISATVREPAGVDLRGADLAGRDLRSWNLARADLRNAVLIGADLRGVDLSFADLLGADLRGCDVRGSDLRTALFVTRPQLAAAVGDATTSRPSGWDGPASWT